MWTIGRRPPLPEPIGLTVGDLTVYQAQPKQDLFHRSTEPNVLFGGAAGGAKSVALRFHGIIACVQNAGLRVLLMRRQFTELEQTHLLTILRGDPPHIPALPEAVAKYDGQRHQLIFPNDAVMQFGHCNTDNDFASYLSTAYDLILVDEAGQFTPYQLAMMPSRVGRRVDVAGRYLLASNPGGPGHQWLFERFIERRVRDGTKYDPANFLFIQSLLTDNAYINPEYRERIESLPEAERLRFMGDWRIASGNLFSELDFHRHYRPTYTWSPARRVVSADWGWDAPAPALWIQTDDGLDGQFVQHQVYREWCPTETPPEIWAQGVVERSREDTDLPVEAVILDEAAFGRPQDGGPPPAEQMLRVFREAGIRLIPSIKGKGSVAHGVTLLHTYFWDYAGAVAPLLTISEDCPLLWQALVTVQRGDASKGNDPRVADKPAARQPQLHLVDALRYFVQSRPQPAPITKQAALDRDALYQKLKSSPASWQQAELDRKWPKGRIMPPLRDTPEPKRNRQPWQRNR